MDTEQLANGTNIQLSFNKVNQKDGKGYDLIQIVLATIMLALLIRCVTTTFLLNDISLFVYVAGIAFTVLLFYLRKSRLRIIGLLMFLMVLLFILFNQYTVSGLILLFNHLVELVGLNTGLIFSQYEITLSTELENLAVNIMMIYVGLFLSIICYYAVQRNRSIFILLFIIPLFIFQAIFHTGELYTNSLLGIIFIFIFLKTTNDKHAIVGSGKSVAFTFVVTILLIITGIISMIMLIVKPVDGYEKNNHVSHIEDALKQKAADVRYEKSKVHSFTEGDFTKLGELELKEDIALEVMMEQPTSIYLRGFTGSTYTSEAWENLNYQEVYKYKDTFYWLNQEDFHALNQLSTINELVEQNELMEKTRITVHNLNGNSKYIYTPYELITNPEELQSAKLLSDNMIQANNFFGDRIYTYDAYKNLVKHYPTLANELYRLSNAEKSTSYLNNERHYNEFVYKMYTELSEEVEHIIGNHLHVEGDAPEHIAYEKAINYVRNYLEENISYTLNPEPLPEKKDFLIHVLEDSQEGYATHYATVATLMFRYLNIPSRYVEGYIVAPEDIEGKESYEKIGIKGTNAHAWTEIYVDKIGWIPLEMTPPYYKRMEQIDLSNYPQGMEKEKETNQQELVTDTSAGTQKIKDKEQEEREVIDKKEVDSQFSWKKLTVAVFIGFLSLLVLISLIYVIIKRIQLLKRKKLFSGPNLNKGTTKMFSYILLLFHYDGIKERGGSTYTYLNDIQQKYGASFAASFKEIIAINQSAIYSGKATTLEEHQLVDEFKEITLKKVVKSKNIFQRVKMKFWDFIY